MRILSSKQLKEADAFTIKNEPITSIDLMERAATKCAEWILHNKSLLPKEGQGSVLVFCGTGNNGGDGLVIARKLIEKEIDVKVYGIQLLHLASADFITNQERLEKLGYTVQMINEESIPEIKPHDFVIDCIFGTGLNKALEALAKAVVNQINNAKAFVLAIDIPSGLFSENNLDVKSSTIVKANYTLTFNSVKISFLFSECYSFCGEWEVLDIGLQTSFISEIETPFYLLQKNDIKALLRPRQKFAHKGTYGHALLIAGSYGKMGAAVLAAKAALRSGVGLLSVKIPACGYTVMQTAVLEAMVQSTEGELYVEGNVKNASYAAIGIGPGLGTQSQSAATLKLLIQNQYCPLVFDADAINILAENKTWLSFIKPECVFTPHHGEFERLVGKSSNSYEQLQMQIDFSKKYKAYLVLKGAYTRISTPDGRVFFNSTGNPGMASGGSGDVLSGIITALLAQSYTSLHACLIGVYVHGLAGDIAAEKFTQTSMIASDCINTLPKAFKRLS
jgi:hydroxyethylthiazole kinase-like uncharacterized protein yjeF